MASAVYFRTSSQRHNLEQKHWQNYQSGPQRFLYITSCRAHFKNFQVKTHVKTARESPGFEPGLSFI